MKIPSLVKLPKNKQFSFRPRYYDPVMEDLNERVSKIKKEMGEEQNPQKQSRSYINFRSTVNKKGSNQTRYIRLAIFGILLLNGYIWILYGFSLIFKIILLIEISISYIWYRVQKGKKNSV